MMALALERRIVLSSSSREEEPQASQAEIDQHYYEEWKRGMFKSLRTLSVLVDPREPRR